MTNEMITNNHVCNKLITNQKREIETCLREIAKDYEWMREIEKCWRMIKNEKLKNVDEWLKIIMNEWKMFTND